MSHLIHGIISFPTIFTPKLGQGASEEKYSCMVLLPATDPQVPVLQAAVEAAKANSFPNGYTGTDCCFDTYDVKFAGKTYFDPRFVGWYVFSCSAKATDKPSVVDASHQPIIDPGAVRSGMMVYVSAGLSGYTKGRGGIGGWLNGVMSTGEMGSMGDLSGKPSVEQMFAGVGAPVAPAPAPAPAPAGPVMLPAANGATYESFIDAGWTEQQMIDNGMMAAPVSF